jgi:hypothetical protein
MVKIQVIGASKVSPLTFLVVHDGATFEYTLMEDTAPEVLKAMRAAAKARGVVVLDVNDIRATRRVGV